MIEEVHENIFAIGTQEVDTWGCNVEAVACFDIVVYRHVGCAMGPHGEEMRSPSPPHLGDGGRAGNEAMGRPIAGPQPRGPWGAKRLKIATRIFYIISYAF